MQSSTKKLTIAFPLYGQHEMFERALTALTKQTFTDFKVVCLDDKSPVNFEELVHRFKDKLDITIEYNETNLGAMMNIWKSVQIKADTPYILSHHADDFLKADYLERAIAILEQDKNISFVLTGPEWVPASQPYEYKVLGNTQISKFDAAHFAYNILNFAPYIFGSVVYRATDRVSDWKYAEMDTYCDRYFLGEILRTNKSNGAYIHGNGIIERDHSKDTADNRSPSLNENHAIHLLAFYKELLLQKFTASETEKIITNNILYYYSNFNLRSNLLAFYKKQRPFNLIQFHKIRLLGLYAILVLPLQERHKRKVIQTIKKIRLSLFGI